jgi:DNA-binding MarR family transcriptional regulator
MSAAMKPKRAPEETTLKHLYVNFQKIFRCLNVGRSMQDRTLPITVTQMRVLSFFSESDVVYISEVSRALGMSIQSVNNLVRRLELLGYVERTKNEMDKRLSDIRLTAKGRERFEVYRNDQFEILTGILQQLEPTEKKILAATIENAALMLEKAALKASNGDK